MACCLSINFFFLFALSVAGARLESDVRVLTELKAAAADVEKKAAADARDGYQEADGARKVANQKADAATTNREIAANAAKNAKPLEASKAEQAAKANAGQAEESLEKAQDGRDKALGAKKTSERETASKIKTRNEAQSRLNEAKEDESETASAIQAAVADLEVKKADADVASQATVGLTSLGKSAAKVYQAGKDAVDEAVKRAKQSFENAQQTVSVQSEVQCMVECLSKEHDVSLRECMYFQCGISLLSDAAEDATDKIIENPLTGGDVTDYNVTDPNDTDNFTEVEWAANRVYVHAGRAVEAATSIVPASHTAWYLSEAKIVHNSFESKNYTLRPKELQKAAEDVGFLADKALSIAEESSEKLDFAKSFLASAESALNDVEEISKSLTMTNDESQQALTAAETKLEELKETNKGQLSAIDDFSQKLLSLENIVEESEKYTNRAKESYKKAEDARHWTEKATNTAKKEVTRAGECREEAQRLESCHNKCNSKDFKACKFLVKKEKKEKCKERHQGICKGIECIKKSC